MTIEERFAALVEAFAGRPDVEVPHEAGARGFGSDALRVNGNDGDDTIQANGLEIPVIFTADGGAGNDTLTGSNGDDEKDQHRVGDRIVRAEAAAGDDEVLIAVVVQVTKVEPPGHVARHRSVRGDDRS